MRGWGSKVPAYKTKRADPSYLPLDLVCTSWGWGCEHPSILSQPQTFLRLLPPKNRAKVAAEAAAATGVSETLDALPPRGNIPPEG